ncbi:hypothetical protein [Bradyrhizobium sp. dw_411]|uniref:hypothetical protein n=1 Tax=Bradyrhizobium sp. dw_411 TaxID=2720082 RepID=UPI001BD01AF1|nr:hypothetical protein [Bradyrhizobium sp. dw_411]
MPATSSFMHDGFRTLAMTDGTAIAAAPDFSRLGVKPALPAWGGLKRNGAVPTIAFPELEKEQSGWRQPDGAHCIDKSLRPNVFLKSTISRHRTIENGQCVSRQIHGCKFC